ncbi:MAG: hypothetical protein NTV05_06070 [Acidobacteria bacterium]|nr:hypothetical protein [Acidobacteriota bacterium]
MLKTEKAGSRPAPCAARHNALALRLAGYGNPAVFTFTSTVVLGGSDR